MVIPFLVTGSGSLEDGQLRLKGMLNHIHTTGTSCTGLLVLAFNIDLVRAEEDSMCGVRILI